MLFIFGICVFVLIFGGILRANARRWRYLAKSYAAAAPAPIEKRSLQSVVLLGLGGYNSLKGIVTIGAHDDGVSLRVMTPFSLFHAPLFVPYSDIRGFGTSWYVDGRSSELTFRQAPDVKLVMPSEQAEWIAGFAGHRMLLRETPPPQGKAGQGWRAFALIHAGIGLGMVAWLSVQLLSGKLG